MRELLFSVTAKDCRFDYYRGSGAGGQHRNKTESAVRCTHLASGAVGQAEDHREQQAFHPVGPPDFLRRGVESELLFEPELRIPIERPVRQRYCQPGSDIAHPAANRNAAIAHADWPSPWEKR